MSKTSRTALAQAVTAKLLAEPAREAEIVRATAAYLVDNNMVKDADLIINDIAHELYVQSGRLTVEVTSASRLSDTAKQELVDFLKVKTGAKSVTLHEIIDENIVGGLRARTPDAEIDVSVQNQLRKLAALA